MFRIVLNVLWLVLVGWASALTFALAALIMTILVVTIPFGIASWRLAVYSLWPFGRTLVPSSAAGAASSLGNVLWFVLAGVWIFLSHLVAAVGFAVTIIGIPFAIAAFKIGLAGLAPLGKQIVDTDRLIGI